MRESIEELQEKIEGLEQVDRLNRSLIAVLVHRLKEVEISVEELSEALIQYNMQIELKLATDSEGKQKIAGYILRC